MPFARFGAGPGLARVTALNARLGLDLARFSESAAVVLGSNGKGSTAAMTAALLQTRGARVGLFTSPHLFALSERFRIDGEDIVDADLERHWSRVSGAIEAAGLSEDVGGFEFLFLIAADWFAARGCSHTVWEAGIGGRLDPTRLVAARRLALVSLDLEHTELLGATLEEIARDKLDAAPDGARVYAGVGALSARDAIEAHCVARGLDLIWPPPLQMPAPLAGAYQTENAALAVALARDLLESPFEDSAIAEGLAATRWPGRLEIIASDPLALIDVGHTPRAVAQARAGFDALRGGRDGVLVCGVSHDKDVAGIVAALSPGFSTIICTTALHKGAPAAHLAATAQRVNASAELIVTASVSEAHAAAFAKARKSTAAIYAAGGLFLAAEFKAVHLGRDPASLVFF